MSKENLQRKLPVVPAEAAPATASAPAPFDIAGEFVLNEAEVQELREKQSD